jgi:hypothetical protein
MGVNLTAIYLTNTFERGFHSLISSIENREYVPLKAFYKSIIVNDYIVWNDFKPQWYSNDKKVNIRPKLPNINSAIEVPEGFVLRFRNDGFEVWSTISVQTFINQPEVIEKAISIYHKIGKDFNAEECWIMGDNNPILFSFREFSKNTNFRIVAKNDIEKNELKDIYSQIKEGDYAGCYEVKGHYKLKINRSTH